MKLENALILVFFWISPCLFLFPSRVPWQSNNFIYEWKMLQVASVKVQVANVRYKVSKWVMAIVSEKCLKLQVANVKVQAVNVRCRVSKWTNVKVLSEWVRCKIFELMKGQSNKKSWKPLKAYSHPIHCHRCVKNRRAKGSSIEGCHARGASTEGGFTESSTIRQISLQLTC